MHKLFTVVIDLKKLSLFVRGSEMVDAMLILKPVLFNTLYLFYIIGLKWIGYCYLKGRSDIK